MDKELFCHTVASETAKAFTSTNMSEYINVSGSAGFAKDFAEKYLEAYSIAKKTYNDNSPKWTI